MNYELNPYLPIAIKNSALIVTDCEMPTLKRFENVKFNVTLMEPDMKRLTDFNLSHCFKPAYSMSELLPAFIPFNRKFENTTPSFAGMKHLPYDEIYETLSAYDREQLNTECWYTPKKTSD